MTANGDPSHYQLVFTMRRHSSVVHAVVVCPSVCLFVLLSYASIVPKWLSVGSCKQRRAIAQDSSFLTPKILSKSQQSHPQRACHIAVG